MRGSPWGPATWRDRSPGNVEGYLRWLKGREVVSSFLCKICFNQFFEEWQVFPHFPYRV